MVEFAIILPLFLLMLLIAVDFGRVFFTEVQLSNAVREAANYGATNPLDVQGMLLRANRERGAQSQGGQQDTLVYPTNISTKCALPNGANLSCALSPGGDGAGNTLTVTLNAPFKFYTPLISAFFGGSLQVRTAATVAVLNSAAGPGSTPPPVCAAPTVAKLTVTSTNLTVTLDPTGSLPESGLCAISGYLYDFGDGNDGVGGTVPTTYTYATGGTYTIKLTVTNQGGFTSTSTTVTIPTVTTTTTTTGTTTTTTTTGTTTTTTTTAGCAKPSAQFMAEHVGNGGSNQDQFTDQSSTPPGCPITNWLWDFGDDTPLTNAPNPLHTFPKNKTYKVTLTVTNAGGSSTIAKDVNS